MSCKINFLLLICRTGQTRRLSRLVCVNSPGVRMASRFRGGNDLSLHLSRSFILSAVVNFNFRILLLSVNITHYFFFSIIATPVQILLILWIYIAWYRTWFWGLCKAVLLLLCLRSFDLAIKLYLPLNVHVNQLI